MSELLYRVHDGSLEDLIEAMKFADSQFDQATKNEDESLDVLVSYARLDGSLDDRTAELARLFVFNHERRVRISRFCAAIKSLESAVPASNGMARMRLAHAVLATYLALKALGERP